MNTTLYYKDHAIIAVAKRDDRTRRYKPVVQISWLSLDRRRESHSLVLTEACDTFDEAITRALAEAKAWADRRLIHVGP